MNRTIYCRAKRIDNGKWVYGALFQSSEELDKTFIIFSVSYGSSLMGFDGVEVDPSTVGQFVAHCKGIDLYEGDKVVVRGTRRQGNYETFIKHHGMGFILDSNKTYFTEYRWLAAVISTNGTIHDTPADGK